MKLVDAYTKLNKLNQAILLTRDAAACLTISTTHASKLLSRMTKAEFLIKISQGLWAFPERAESLLVPQYLTLPLPSYVSLQTALYYHGMISQIPDIVYAISLARTRKHRTPMGVFSIHHVTPEFFYGYEQIGKYRINIATPEKALVDLFYLTPSKTKLFSTLPEVEFPESFNINKVWEIIDTIPDIKRRTMAKKRFEELIRQCSLD